MSEPYPRPSVPDKGLTPLWVSLRPVVDLQGCYTSLCCQRPFAKVRNWRQGILTSPLTELQNLTNLRLSSFAESHQMQQKNFDISPYAIILVVLVYDFWLKHLDVRK